MQKIALSSTVILAFLAYAFFTHNPTSDSLPVTVPPKSSPVSDSSTAPVSTQTPTNTPISSNRPTGAFKDGSYKGDVTDAFYGNIQVQATISGGKITDVVFLDHPQDRQTSQEINNQAMPLLKQEAIAVQNANVDIVSGATQTSLAFQKSLQSALNQAKS